MTTQSQPLPALAAPRRFSTPQLVAFDVLVVICVTLGAQLPPYVTPGRQSQGVHTTWVVCWVLISFVVLFRRRWPRATLVVVLVLGALSLGLRSPAPISNFFALALYSTTVVSTRRAGITAAVTTAVVAVAGTIIGDANQVALFSVTDAAVILVGWMTGEYIRVSRDYAHRYAALVALQAAAADAESREQVLRAVAEERVKLARELHDVVAHAMSVIAVRAGVARMVIDTQPGQAREALGIIETTTRRTLQEMRLLVGVLRRADDPQAELGPAPGLADLPQLITDIELTGVRVELVVEGPERPLNPAEDLSAYRIVQEALTNVVRHAGPTTAHLTLGYRPNELSLEIVDDGPDPHRAPDPALIRQGTGHGLIGIGERAALFGGEVSAGPQARGYRLQATLRTTDFAGEPVAGELPTQEPSR
jgi:signal transduction histidine kinase